MRPNMFLGAVTVGLFMGVALAAGEAHADLAGESARVADPQTIYVDDNYTSGTAGWGYDHFDSIQDGLDAAVNGTTETIIVYPGTYRENVNFDGKAVTVTSTNPYDSSVVAGTVINGDGTGTCVRFDSSEDSSSVLKGLTLRNGRARYGGGIFCLYSSPTISKCRIVSNVSYHAQYGHGGGVYLSRSSPTIVDCEIMFNTTSGNGGGLYFWHSDSSPRVVNCVIAHNTAAWGGGGIASTEGATPAFTNCTVHGNSANYGGGIWCYDGSDDRMTNCILWMNSAQLGPEIQMMDSSDLTVSYCDVRDGESGADLEPDCALHWGAGNITVNPRFVGAGSVNYHLWSNSPCIDAADGDLAPAKDIESKWRSDNPGAPNTGFGPPWVDMGAYECLDVYNLTVQSVNPGSGVSVEVRPWDMNGRSEGTTPFVSRYAHGTPLRLTAPAVIDDGGTDRGIVNWKLDGVAQLPGHVKTSFPISAATTAKATYVTIEEGLVRDNTQAGFAVLSGSWPRSTAMGGYYGADYGVSASGSGKMAQWTPNLPAQDWYTLYARWTAGSNRTSKARYMIYHMGGTDAVTVDQRRNGGKWMPLGCFQFEQGVGDAIELSNHARGRIVADALMWTSCGQGVIVDNKDSGFEAVSGIWPTSGRTGGYYGTNYAVHSAGGAGHMARWTPNLPATGDYALYGRWTSGRNRSRKAQYTVNYDGGSAVLTVNQKAFGGEWVFLGTYPFLAGETGNVELTESPLGCVIADAAMWLPCDDAGLIVDNVDSGFTTVPDTGFASTSSFSGGYYGADYAFERPDTDTEIVTARWTPDLPGAGDHMVYARWTAGSNRSGNVAYSVKYDGGTTAVRVNQKRNGGKWWLLGVFPFAAGTGGYVQMPERPDGLTVADAMMWQAVQAGLVVDNTDPGYAVIAGTWPTSSHSPGYYGANYAFHRPATGVNKVKFTPTISTGGTYAVYARWTSHKTRSRKARYRVFHADGSSVVYLNQRGFGGEWLHLGDYPFSVGTSGYVDVSASPYGIVVADAVMWVLKDGAPCFGPPQELSSGPGSNELPVASAACLTEGPSVGARVALSGADSYDPDDGPEALTCQWTQVAGPEVRLDDVASAEAVFTPAVAGVYVFELEVSDGEGTSAADVVVSVSAASP